MGGRKSEVFLRQLDRTLWPAIGILALAALLPASARADTILTIGSTTVTAGSSGSIDVTLQNTGGAPDPIVNAFFFKFSTSNSFVSFTEANISTAPTYIFAGNSLFGPVISLTPPPSGQLVDSSDVAAIGNGTTVPAASTFGLGHILFNIAPSAPAGTAPLVFDVVGTSLSDVNGNAIPIIALNNGSINITTAASVPEPSTLTLIAPVLLAAFALRARSSSVRNSH
jgi:hypothetical protein